MHTTTLRVHITATPSPHEQRLADTLLGTLHPTHAPDTIPLPDGQYFRPVTPLADALRARLAYLPPHEAHAEVQRTVTQAAHRRASCGTDWHLLTVRARAINHHGDLLAQQVAHAVPSDLPAHARAHLNATLARAARQDALDWAILGLN